MQQCNTNSIIYWNWLIPVQFRIIYHSIAPCTPKFQAAHCKLCAGFDLKQAPGTLWLRFDGYGLALCQVCDFNTTAKCGHVAHPRSLSIESSAKQLYGHGSGRNLNKRGPAQDSFISVWCERKSSMMSNDTRPLRWGHWVTPGCFPT